MSYVKIKEETIRVFRIEEEFIWKPSCVKCAKVAANNNDGIDVLLRIGDDYGNVHISIGGTIGCTVEFPLTGGFCCGILSAAAAKACDYVYWKGYKFDSDTGIDRFFDELVKLLENL